MRSTNNSGLMVFGALCKKPLKRLCAPEHTGLVGFQLQTGTSPHNGLMIDSASRMRIHARAQDWCKDGCGALSSSDGSRRISGQQASAQARPPPQD
jgi:hypothetical protein